MYNTRTSQPPEIGGWLVVGAPPAGLRRTRTALLFQVQLISGTALLHACLLYILWRRLR
ncbi:putative membrane protein [Paenibacillus riograndensis SBR5]|uniref:Putative membrane protein n=1 Tax=Paenibacillus riograndensis SBR5 TaxID=1073571 RepID=A0A0E3WG95_9BACL|nr:putative membrane protein [Paenibacillus riograndensis SBR5]